MTFGDRLKKLRLASGMTQIDIAKKINLSKANISKYEANLVEPNLETLIKISNIFDVSIDYLLCKIDNPSPHKKELTQQDRLNIEIAKLTPEKRKNALQYIEFLKTQQEFAEDISTALDTLSQKPLTEL